jgi:hypothetical protein
VHFLLVYDHAEGRLLEQREFADADEAVAAYAVSEQQHRWDRDLEIVLIGADSIETIHRTHGHYFGSDEGFRIEPLVVAV